MRGGPGFQLVYILSHWVEWGGGRAASRDLWLPWYHNTFEDAQESYQLINIHITYISFSGATSQEPIKCDKLVVRLVTMVICVLSP